jgi:hypothetical protein
MGISKKLIDITVSILGFTPQWCVLKNPKQNPMGRACDKLRRRLAFAPSWINAESRINIYPIVL